MSDVYVLGVDMIKFGRFPERTVPDLGAEAALLRPYFGGVCGFLQSHDVSSVRRRYASFRRSRRAAGRPRLPMAVVLGAPLRILKARQGPHDTTKVFGGAELSPTSSLSNKNKKTTRIICGKKKDARAGPRPNGPNPCSPPRANGTETGRACSTQPKPHLGHPARTVNGTPRQWLPDKTGQKSG